MNKHIQHAIDAGFLKSRHSIDQLANLINSIVSDGAKQLHIVADFDMTLTTYWVHDSKGQAVRNASSHAIVMESPLFPEWAVKETNHLFRAFYPIEIDPQIPREKKLRAMEQWWEKAHVILEKSGIRDDTIRTMVEQSGIVMREGAREFMMETCKNANIPIIVFSAGLANVIEYVFQRHDLLAPHIHIISNRIIFQDGVICRVDPDPPIHVLNKSEASLLHLPDHDALEGRPNVILMGDAAGDIHMADGIDHKHKLSIGFLHVKVEANLPLYLETFDIVLLQDPPLDWINWIVARIDAGES